MNRLGSSILIAGLSFLGSVGSSQADVVELKTGQRVEGTLRQASPAGVVVEVGGQTIRFDADKVRAIYFGAAPVVTPATAAPAQTALTALKGLRSAVEVGVTVQDYQRRLADAMTAVDQYLGTPPANDEPARIKMSAAVALYAIGAEAWRARLQREFVSMTDKRPLLRQQCPEARKEFQEVGPTSGAPSRWTS